MMTAMTVILLRHGETAWDLVNARGWPGAANDLAPLTPTGVRQAGAAAEALSGQPVGLLLASPMTRAMQTASVVGARLGVPLQVELDLREWCPDQTYRWTTSAEVFTAYDDLLAHDGLRPEGHPLRWESLPEVRARARAVLAPYAASSTVVVAVCHEVVIHALTGVQQTPLGTTRAMPVGP
jgi:broad specificity phosphatase PhoE